MGELAPSEPLPRPLAEGLQLIAADPVAPGLAYDRLMQWARETGDFGYDNMWSGWIPQFTDAVYVSTTITSGGHARDESLPLGEAIERNTLLAATLTDLIISDCALQPKSVVLASDLPKVEGWKQSDYMIFWLSLLEGMPGDIAEEAGAYLQHYAAKTKLDDRSASYEERWSGYQSLVEEFLRTGRALALHGRNDYMQQRPRFLQMIQLLDAGQSLGCRAEELYARERGLEIYKVELRPDQMDEALRRQLGKLSSLGVPMDLVPPGAVRLVKA